MMDSHEKSMKVSTISVCPLETSCFSEEIDISLSYLTMYIQSHAKQSQKILSVAWIALLSYLKSLSNTTTVLKIQVNTTFFLNPYLVIQPEGSGCWLEVWCSVSCLVCCVESCPKHFNTDG